MPLDTSIPLSFQPPQLPDFNALAQQRGQNVANMLTIQNSIADRQAAQDEAQAAALEKALTPALAAAFTNPTDEGLVAAFDLVPDQYKEAAKEQLVQLQSIPDVNMRKSVLRSGLAQYDFGKVILQQVEPSASAALQAKTAEQRAALDQQRLALDKAKLEAEAKGGKVAQWVTGDDGTVTGLDEYGNTVATIPGIGKKATATGPDGVKLKPGERVTPEGNVEAVPGSDLYTKQKANYTKDYKGATTVVDKIAEAKAKIDRITSEDNASGFAGNFGGYNAAYATQYFPGQTQDVASDIESLKADLKNAGLELIRNGGSIGQITEREWPIIEQQLANLTPMLSEAKARDILANIAARLDNISARAIETYDMQWGDTQFYTPVAAKPVTSGKTRNAPATSTKDTGGEDAVDTSNPLLSGPK